MRLSSWLFCVPLIALACSNGDSKPSNGDGSGGSGGAQGGESNGGASQGGANQGGDTATATGGSSGGTKATTTVVPCPAPIDLGVRFVGRYDGCATDGVRIRWSGSGFVGAFNGTGLSVRLRETAQANYYNVLIDGALVSAPILTKQQSESTYVLATGLTAGSHKVEFLRRTEASFGITTILGLTVEGGTLETPPAKPERLIEVVGDSISCGYGNLGEYPCSFSAETEDHYLAYGSLLARKFNAELSTVAWSGKGVVTNYNGEVAFDRMPQLYDRAVPGDKRSTWDFHTKPQAVLINLGTNDYSSSKDPADTDFATTYEGMLSSIREHNPDAYILCTIGPMLTGSDLTKARTNIKAAVAARKTAGDNNVEAYDLLSPNDSPGCDSHPDLAAHQAIADELAVKLQGKLGW